MECPNCQSDITDDSLFCNKCGTKIVSSAPDLQSFNEKLDKIQRYLPEGLSQKILEQKDRIEGERKQVTVLFCDMVGFTPMTEKLGPEKTYKIMDQVLEILIHKVHDYGGTVNQLTGDGLYALFGVPITVEDAASRAIRAGLVMHRDITEFSSSISEDWDIPPLRLRIGINSGPVVVGTLGNDLRVEFKAVGDTVNLAKRMEGLAEPSTIAVTEETYKQAQTYIKFEPLGERKVKGKEEPVAVYKVVAEKEKDHRRLTSDRIIQSEMVGRETELDQLELAVAKAKNSEGSIVNIIGEAGIGKSRLIAELKASDIVKRTTILEGRALSMGRNLSFYPIIEILKAFAGIGEDDSALAQLSKLETAVVDIHPEQAEEIIPFIGSLMGLQLSGKYAERVEGIEGEALEKLIYKNLREFILKSAEVSPLIFVLEDLHWADTSSIDLIISLCRLVENNRILIINIFRPYYEETGEKLRTSLEEEYPGQVSEIRLHSLDSNQSDQLIDNLLKIEGLPADMRDQIKERSEGNPFFIEEMARSMIDEGAIELADGRFQVTRKIDSVVVPNTIQELLMSRIDRLDEKTKSLLRTASVIGRHFFHKILFEVIETVEEIDDKLGYLQEIQLIREGRRLEEVEYLFKHALAQETTYGSILQERRKELHLKVAESFERVFADRLSEFYGMLAYHYNQGGDLNKTEEYMLKAGEEALKSSASSEALDYFRNTIELYSQRYGDQADPKKMAILEANLANALYNKGYHAQSVDYFERAMVNLGYRGESYKHFSYFAIIKNLILIVKNLYFPSIRHKKVPTRLDNQIMSLLQKRGNAIAFVDSKALLVQGLDGTRMTTKADCSHSIEYIEALAQNATFYAFSGLSYRLARKILNSIERNNSDLKTSVSPANLIEAKVTTDFFAVSWDDAEFEEEIFTEILKTGVMFYALNYLFFIGMIQTELGNFTKTKNMLDRKLNLNQQFHDENIMLYYHNLNIWYSIKIRDTDRCLTDVSEALSLLDKIGQKALKVRFIGFKIYIEVLQQKLESAKRTIEEGARLINELGEMYIPPFFMQGFMLGKLHYYIALIENRLQSDGDSKLKGLSDHGKDLSLLIRKLIKSSKKHRVFNVEVFRLIGKIYWLHSKPRKALKWFDKSTKAGEKLNVRPELARTYMEVGKRLLEPGSKYNNLNGITAEEYLEKARLMFEKMDLQWDLEQLEKVKRGE